MDIGDELRRGQLVALLEDDEYQQEVLQAEADLGVAKANLEEAASSQELAQKELERARTLHAERHPLGCRARGGGVLFRNTQRAP